TGEIAKKLEVLPPNIGQHTKPRLNHAQQRRQFTGMVRPDFEHGRVVVAPQVEQGERHAYLIVEAGLAPEGVELLAQDGGKQLLGGRLAIRPAYGDDGQTEIPA